MRPLVISHAACAGHAPDNTLAGIHKAIELGAEAIEIDVQLSADGVPVLMHDRTVDRTTNGRGKVAKLSVKELGALDAGDGEPVPTLAEVLDLTQGKVLLVMEIKKAGIEEKVVRVVREAKALSDVMAWSFYPKALKGMRAAEPRIPCALLIEAEAMAKWPEMRDRALKIGVQGVSAFFLGINDAIVESCRNSGLALYCWTADQEKQIETLVALGVDGICSNYPDRVVKVLAGAQGSGMTEASKELIGRWFAAQASGDISAVRAILAEDVVWHVPGHNLLSRDYEGPDEVLGFLARVRELSGGTARPQVVEVLPGDGYVVTLVRMFAEREGRKLDGSFQAWAYRIAAGRIAEFWFLVEDRYEVDAFWS